eukprot:5393176-Prymnesium_polylepis.2
MDIVAEALHAAGKFRLERNDVAVCATLLRPAVVDVHILEAGIAQAGCHHGPRHLLDQTLVDLTTECGPRVPAEGRRETDSILQGDAVPYEHRGKRCALATADRHRGTGGRACVCARENALVARRGGQVYRERGV